MGTGWPKYYRLYLYSLLHKVGAFIQSVILCCYTGKPVVCHVFLQVVNYSQISSQRLQNNILPEHA